MFDDGEEIQPELKFAMAAVYDKFSKRWDLPTEKQRWIDLWAPLMRHYSVVEVNTAADYCAKEFRRPPVPAELIELANRVRQGRALSEPIVAKIERMAYLILSSDEFNGAEISNSEISDACLIAGAIAHLKSYQELLPNADFGPILEEFVARAKLFVTEAETWKRDAEAQKGYWVDVFATRRGL